MLPIVLAAVLGCGDFCAPAALGHYAALLEAGGYGRLPFERSAFLIREPDGTITLERWENSDFQRAVYRGAIPAGTIAVAHTHPLATPQPSAGDRSQARRLRLPIIVITPSGVTAAFPDGSVRRLMGGESLTAERTPVPASETGLARLSPRRSLRR